MVAGVEGKVREDHQRSFHIRSGKRWGGSVLTLTKTLRRRMNLLPELHGEERIWRERGVTLGRAKDEEQPFIQQTIAAHAGELDNVPVSAREFLVARRGQRVVAFARIHRHSDGARELASMFVAEEERGRHLGTFLIRSLFRSVWKDSIFALADPKLREYYADVGFRVVRSAPTSILRKDERLQRVYPNDPPCLTLRYDAWRFRNDCSLSCRPDLIVVDGGHSPLRAASEVIQSLGIDVPVIGLGWEGEIYVKDSAFPLRLSIDEAPASVFLRRLRDEAFRAAQLQSFRGKIPVLGAISGVRLLAA
jgi:N-acetylglutamate synthase-like GNAT family acetyltransferase